jgi:hypothetical protein
MGRGTRPPKPLGFGSPANAIFAVAADGANAIAGASETEALFPFNLCLGKKTNANKLSAPGSNLTGRNTDGN